MDFAANTSSATGTLAKNRQDAYTSPWLLAASCLPILVLSLFFMRERGTKLPYLNPKGRFEWSSARAVQEMIFDARRKLYRSASGVLGKPFRVLSDVGDVIILPPDVGQEIRNDKRFSFTQRLFEVDNAPATPVTSSLGQTTLIETDRELYRTFKADMLASKRTRRLPTRPRDSKTLSNLG